MGVQVYTLEYETEIEFLEACKWNINTFAGAIMDDELSFRTTKSPDKPLNELAQLAESATNPGTAVSKGQRFKLVGAIRFEKKEKGWWVDGVKVTSITALPGSGNPSAPQTERALEHQTSSPSNKVAPTAKVTSITGGAGPVSSPTPRTTAIREATDPVAKFNLQMDDLNTWIREEGEKIRDESTAFAFIDATWNKAKNLDTKGLPEDFKAAWTNMLSLASESLTAAKATGVDRADLREKGMVAWRKYETLVKKYDIHGIALAKPQQPATTVPTKDRPKANAAQMQIVTLKTALDAYEVDNGYYPKGKNGLLDLIRQPLNGKNWRGPYLASDSIPKDPWGNDYVYECPGQHNPGSYDLMSMGPDGRVGGGDDISNWNQ
jgi:general secretion pathway protein G